MFYFLQFQKYHPLAVKLERVAETFTMIAEAYVRQTFRGQFVAPSVRGPGAPMAEEVTTHRALSEEMRTATGPQQLPYFQQSGQPDHEVRLNETSALDPNSLFKLFTYSSSDQATDDQEHNPGYQFSSTARTLESAGNAPNEPIYPPGCHQALEPNRYVSMRDVELAGRHQFSDCTFDWFALDSMEI